MYHSIIFGDKNTYDDWHLIPLNRPTFTMPTPKTETIEIPGSNHVIDLTELLAGEPVFSNRTGSFQFIIENGKEDFFQLTSRIANYLNGHRMKASLEDDPLFYYEGRFTVTTASGARHSQVTIDYDVHPYKRSFDDGLGNYLWDPFSFIDGIVRDYADMPFGANPYILELRGFEVPVSPEFVVTMDRGISMTIETDDGVKHILNAGTNIISTWKLENGMHPIKIYGNDGSVGRVSIRYEERSM